MKRSLHICGVDDDGNTIYSLSETKTITTQIKIVTQAEYEEEARLVRQFNEDNSELNLIKQMFERNNERMENSPDPAAYARDQLIRAGILYPDGTSKQYKEDGDLIPFNEIKRRRANANND